MEAARPCWEIDSLPLSQRVPFKQETSLCYMFPVSAHRHGVNFHFFSSFWNSQTLLTKLRQENCRISTHSHPQFFLLLFFFPLFRGLFFPTRETRGMCIPGKVRREGAERRHRHIKGALCALGTLFLESNQVPQNLTRLFRHPRNQSCRPLGLCFL